MSIAWPYLVPAAAAPAGVTLDQAATRAYFSNATSSNYTNLTISAGLTNPGLVVTLQRSHATNDVAAGMAVTWDGVALTLLFSHYDYNAAANTQIVQVWGLRNPAAGNKTLNVSGTNSATDLFVAAISFSNVNQTSDALAFPYQGWVSENNNDTNTASVAVGSDTSHYLVSSMTKNANFTPLATNWYFDNSSGSLINAGASYTQGASPTQFIGTTAAGINGSLVGTDIAPPSIAMVFDQGLVRTCPLVGGEIGLGVGATYTFRNVCPVTAGSGAANKVRVTLYPPQDNASGDLTIVHASVGKSTLTGNGSPTVSTPNELLFGGLSGITLKNGMSPRTSDWVTLTDTFTSSDKLVVIFDLDASNNSVVLDAGALGQTCRFASPGASYNSTADPGGSFVTHSYCILKIEVS